MSDTPGMSMGNTTIHRQNRKRQEGEQSVSSVSLSKAPSAAPKFSGVANVISSIPVNPRIQDLYLASSKEGLPSIVAPESSVILGRSITSYKRGGWLELQERLPEEIAVAIIWLAGVDKLRAVFEWAKKKALPSYDHISTNTAWDRTWGKPTHVDLSPQEMFTKNSKEIDTLLKLKSVRWLFSVGIALTSVAYIIPKANQMKTDMILRHLNRRKRQTEGSNVQFGDPNIQNQASPPRRTSQPSFMAYPRTGFTPQSPGPSLNRPNATQPFSIGNTFAANNQNPYGTQPTQPSFQSPTPYSSYPYSYQPQFQGGNHPVHPAHPGKGVKFGAGFPGASLAQGLGHLVEQTPYGSILVVDAGIAGGRGYVASKRSPYETVEVLFRDLGSLYFYILCAPHMMRLSGGVLNRWFGTSIAIQPKVAEQIHKQINDEINKQSKEAAKSPLTPAMVEKAIKGATGELGDRLMKPEGELKMAMRHAPHHQFLDLLDKETQVYLKDSQHQAQALRAISQQLNDKKEKTIDPQQIDKLLTAIEGRHDEFAKLSSTDRRNLGIAVKQAFRHTVGMTFPMNEIAKQDAFKTLYQDLSMSHDEEATELTKRIKRMAQLDNLNQAHSMLRRGMNVMHDVLDGSKSELFTRSDALAGWIDEAVNRHMTLSELIEHEIEQAKAGSKTFHLPDTLKKKLETMLSTDDMSRLAGLKGRPLSDGTQEVANTVMRRIQTTMRQLTAKAQPNSAEHGLLQHYAKALEQMFQGDHGRLFSLAIEQHDAGLSSKLREMLKGGLENDSRFLHQALDIVGQLETDSRKFASTAKADRMRGQISNYTDALLQKVNQPRLKAKLREELEHFYALNRNLHYGAWTVAMGVTMTCLGWLVPHLQTLLTKRLTGKDIHPGIASAEHAQEASHDITKGHTVSYPRTAQQPPYFNHLANQYAGAAYYRPRPAPSQGA